MRLYRNQKGDTIMEVLICVAVLSFIMSASFALANRTTATNRQSAERGEAFKTTESQMERLKQYLSTITTVDQLPPSGSKFCMKADNTPTSVIAGTVATPADFQAAITVNPEYSVCKTGEFYYTYLQRGPDVSLGIGDNTFVSYTRWENAAGKGIDQATMVHRLYPDQASVDNNIATVTNCAVGQRYDTVAVTCVPCLGDLTSTGAQDTTCECPAGQQPRPAPPANRCEVIPPLPRDPLYRCYQYYNYAGNPKVFTNHVYVTNSSFCVNGTNGGALEGIMAYVPRSTNAGATPMYAAFSPSYFDNFYTISLGEKNTAVANFGYTTDQGIAFYVYPNCTISGTVPLYRWWSDAVGNHFYTVNASENPNNFAGVDGGGTFVYEGTTGCVFSGTSP